MSGRRFLTPPLSPCVKRTFLPNRVLPSPLLAPTARAKPPCCALCRDSKKSPPAEIYFDGRRIDGLPPEEIVALGIAHVPEGRRVFPDMTVEENLRLGAFLRHDMSAVESDLSDIYERFPRLCERHRQHAKTMSGGEQQMLAIGRALMSRPRLLLLDEPSMGLSPMMTEEIGRIVQEVRSKGVSVVLVEQNAELALSLADYVCVGNR